MSEPQAKRCKLDEYGDWLAAGHSSLKLHFFRKESKPLARSDDLRTLNGVRTLLVDLQAALKMMDQKLFEFSRVISQARIRRAPESEVKARVIELVEPLANEGEYILVHKLFEMVDIYCPNTDVEKFAVRALTFSWTDANEKNAHKVTSKLESLFTIDRMEACPEVKAVSGFFDEKIGKP